ncbi:MAG: ASPIC/UnbV domain-containing protein [Planctomycetes bacterium]|nr:ASPIC/UnbV domain-containing protein [Planctomycetota bacterium]
MSRLIWSGSSWSGRERHCAFLNQTDGTFVDVSAILGLDFLDDGRALAATDWDGDGDLDLWFKNRTGPQLRFLRNDGATGHFVSLKLTGASCNRDAIGARVEVHAAGRRIVQTVTAGSGYLAKSTKRLHFGLGDAEKIDKIDIRWPDGSSETLLDAKMDKHYSYVQGSGNLAIVKLPRPALGGPEPLAKPDLLAGRRTVLREPMPLPPDLLGEATAGSHQSTLLTFWAHWCANCRVELTEFTAHDAELRAAGLRIVPLSLDPPADEPKAREVAAALNMPYAVELLGESRTTLVAAVLRSVLDIHEDMAIPMSFLLDRENRIQVIYSGAVSVEQLLADHRVLAQSPAAPSLQRSPFPGRWHASAVRRYSDIVNDLKNADLRDWTRFYLKLDRQSRNR